MNLSATRMPFLYLSSNFQSQTKQNIFFSLRRKYGPDGTIALAFTTPTPQTLVVQSSAAAGVDSDSDSDGDTGDGFSPFSIDTASPSPPPMKRGRGRPRGSVKKQEKTTMVTPAPQTLVDESSGCGGGGDSDGGFSPSSSDTASLSLSMKRGRGRPHGSVKKQEMATLGSLENGLTAHVITVKDGEDVLSKIMSFSQHGPRAVCILSANGAISNVALRQAATSGGTVTYEGRFEILSLSGSFSLSESGGQRIRTGGLSVTLAGPDGRVFGGGVAGLLTAASPVQVVVGSFKADGKEPKLNHSDPSAIPKLVQFGGGVGTGSPPSQGTMSESSGGPGSPLNQSTGACNNSNAQDMANLPWK
ncbi:hypothetical protein AQUCO_10900019v1 [Aquilegia coerulea]|uniref:AT-hook motif nuclear-localized protein n=1 Tax=Aquilegia coerulea TaxID=218851 RepID=A0A2G5C317_AQUCA|nr:hypothetical protein AQUCO_10900019v1 [Aquilegia coerulea]